MSAAPDLVSLFKFEKQIETAVKAVLAIPSFGLHIQRSTDELATPFVAFQFRLGAATGHVQLVPKGSDRIAIKDTYAGTLECEVNTNRGALDQQELHDDYRARIRVAMMDYERTFTATVLPWLLIDDITESGTSPSIDGGNDLDISKVSFAVRFRIRSDAWPTL
jgi:hypothetical protein